MFLVHFVHGCHVRVGFIQSFLKSEVINEGGCNLRNIFTPTLESLIPLIHTSMIYLQEDFLLLSSFLQQSHNHYWPIHHQS